MDAPASLDALRVLASCVRHRSFSRAAAELFVTPSAVSARIRGLEADLGVTLFERRGPKLVATDRALRLAASVEGALASIRSAVDGCRRVTRVVRVTCAPSFARWLVTRLAGYHETRDAGPIALDATSTMLPSEGFDVAIRFGRGPWPRCSAALLLVDRGAPMLSPKLLPDGPMSPRDLLDLPLIADPRWSNWFEAAGVRGAAPRLSPTTFATYELDAAAAASGMGVALLSPILYADMLDSGALVAPFDAVVDGPDSYWVLWQADAANDHFVHWLQAELGAHRGLSLPHDGRAAVGRAVGRVLEVDRRPP